MARFWGYLNEQNKRKCLRSLHLNMKRNRILKTNIRGQIKALTGLCKGKEAYGVNESELNELQGMRERVGIWGGVDSKGLREKGTCVSKGLYDRKT